jgi:hypothetical protein
MPSKAHISRKTKFMCTCSLSFHYRMRKVTSASSLHGSFEIHKKTYELHIYSYEGALLGNYVLFSMNGEEG